MADNLQLFKGAVAPEDSKFFYTDDDGKRFAMLDFLWCDEQQNHKWFLLFVPAALYDHSSLFKTGQPLYVKGVLDQTSQKIYVKDAWVVPSFMAA